MVHCYYFHNVQLLHRSLYHPEKRDFIRREMYSKQEFMSLRSSSLRKDCTSWAELSQTQDFIYVYLLDCLKYFLWTSTINYKPGSYSMRSSSFEFWYLKILCWPPNKCWIPKNIDPQKNLTAKIPSPPNFCCCLSAQQKIMDPQKMLTPKWVINFYTNPQCLI